MNVWGDSIGAGIMDHLSKKEIERIEAENKRNNHGYESIPQEELELTPIDQNNKKINKINV